MTVDGSYMAWARPTRRVHLALSLGMTVTGVILIAAGSSGGPSAARTVPAPGRTADSRAADSVVSGSSGAAAGLVPAAPLVRFAPQLPIRVPAPVGGVPGASVKTHSKSRSHGRHAASVPPPVSSQLSSPLLPAGSAPVTAPVKASVKASVEAPETAPPPAHHLPHPSDLSGVLTPPPRLSSPELPAHPLKH